MYSKLFMPALAGVLLISGCSNLSEQRAQRLAAIPEAKLAYVIGTYAVGCERNKDQCRQLFNSISTSYRNVDDKDFDSGFGIVTGKTFGDDTSLDFANMERRENGIYFCHPLPAGRYSVFAYNFYNFAGGGSGYSMSKEQHFNVPFTLAEGEVVDIGTLKITAARGKNLFGMSLPAPGVLLLSGARDDAVAKALQKCPESVRNRPVRTVTLRAEGVTPFVMADPKP